MARRRTQIYVEDAIKGQIFCKRSHQLIKVLNKENKYAQLKITLKTSTIELQLFLAFSHILIFRGSQLGVSAREDHLGASKTAGKGVVRARPIIPLKLILQIKRRSSFISKRPIILQQFVTDKQMEKEKRNISLDFTEHRDPPQKGKIIPLVPFSPRGNFPPEPHNDVRDPSNKYEYA